MWFGVVTLSVGMAMASSAASAAESAPLQLKPKSGLLEMPVHNSPPFVSPLAAPDIHFRPQLDAQTDLGRSCGDRMACYDPNSGRIEFTRARDYMPDLPGLQRETISVKRDRVIFRYSF